jgi:hypothetical protein
MIADVKKISFFQTADGRIFNQDELGALRWQQVLDVRGVIQTYAIKVNPSRTDAWTTIEMAKFMVECNEKIRRIITTYSRKIRSAVRLQKAMENVPAMPSPPPTA